MMRLAYDILNEIVRGGAYSNLALKKGLAGAERSEARRVTALVYETLERLAYADFLIAAYAKGRLHGSVRNVLRLGITALLFMDTPAYAAIGESAELTKRIGKAGLAGYVNAVLRSIERDSAAGKLPPLPEAPEERLSILYGMPRFMVREYLAEFGPDFTENLLAARLHKLTVRAQYPYTTAELEAELAALGAAFTRGKFDENALVLSGAEEVTELAAFKEGRLTVQSESAMLACRACRVRDGMKVLDACAAPGGKSAYLSSLMHGTGAITAGELHPHRTALMEATFARLGCDNCRAETRDAAKERPDENESYDLVLLDVPCSGLGGGGKPDAMLNRSEEDILSLAALQRSILEANAPLVKQGGALIYSTCTVSLRENRANVLAFLKEHAEFTAEPLSDLLPAGKPEGGADRGDPFLQLLPNEDGIDGFFIARLIKTGRTGTECLKEKQ